jgi:hypothetical protein
MRKPRIKKYCKISKFSVWIVDGKYIRDNINEEFTNFGQHYRFPFIPRNEFWIDNEYGEGNEEEFYIEHLLVENRLMEKGMKYDKAIEIADRVESRERAKSLGLIKEFKNKPKKEEIIKLIHKILWKEYSINGLKVWIVRGELVRDFFFIDFTEGGHDRVYNFVPKGEIWIEEDLNPKERGFVFLHELHERNLMVKGKTYNEAHRSASKVEYSCRKHLRNLDKKIRKEFKKLSKA